MTKGNFFIFAYFMAIVSVAGCTHNASRSTNTGFSHLSAWELKGNANWHMDNGEIIANTGNGYLISPVDYSDFEISLDFYPDDNTNSGIYFRCSEDGLVDGATCYEANIFDHRPSGDGKTGSIPRVSEPLYDMEAEGQWNTYVVTAIGPHLVVKLNGVETVNTMHHRHTKGHIALQFASGGIRFRNIQLRDLSTPGS